MRRGIKFGLALAASLAMAGTATANPRVFLSTSGESPEISAPSVEILPGESASLYLWVIPGESDLGAEGGISLSLVADTGGIVERTGLEMFNPESDLGILQQRRWSGVGVGDVDALELFANVTAVSTSEFGGFQWAGSDPLFDESSGAYLHGRVDFEGGDLGSTNLWLEVGGGRIATFGDFETPIFGADEEPVPAEGTQGAAAVGARGHSASATVTVIPEPGSLALLGIGGLMLLRRRRA